MKARFKNRSASNILHGIWVAIAFFHHPPQLAADDFSQPTAQISQHEKTQPAQLANPQLAQSVSVSPESRRHPFDNESALPQFLLRVNDRITVHSFATNSAQSTTDRLTQTQPIFELPLFSVPSQYVESTILQASHQSTAAVPNAQTTESGVVVYRAQQIGNDGSRLDPNSTQQDSNPLQLEQPIAKPQKAGNFMLLQTPGAADDIAASNSTRQATSGNVTVAPLQANPPGNREAQLNNGTVVPTATQVTAENAGEAIVAAPLTLDVVTARRAAIEQRTDLPDDLKAQALKHLQRAAELVTQRIDAEKRFVDLKAEKDNGPNLVADLRNQLNHAPARTEPDHPAAASVAELDQLRLADEERLTEARGNLEAWENKAKLRTERKPQMPALIETTRKQQEDAAKALSIAAPDGENPVISLSRRTEQEALSLLLKSQLEQYRIEQLRYEALNEMFPLQRDVLTRNRNLLEKRVEQWKTILADARREESTRQAREAREKLRNAHPTLRDLAEHNSSLTQRRKELQEFMGARVTELSAVNATLVGVEQKFRSVTEKEQRAGLTTAIGLLLRSQRNHLPSASSYRRRLQQTEQDIVRLQTEQMQLEDERNDLGDIEAHIESTLGELDSEDASSEELRQMAHELLTDRRKYLDDLLADYDAGLQTLGETDVTCRRLETMIGDYESYIDERVLWIRSASAVDLAFPQRTWLATQSFSMHRQWPALLQFMSHDAQHYWILYVLVVAGFSTIIALERRTRRIISRLGITAQKHLVSGIPQTLLATGLTIITASAWPALLWFTGWRLAQSDLDLAAGLSQAFMFCSAALWLVNSFRGLCRKHGVAEAFLEWPEAIVRSLSSNLLLYIAGGVPLCFIVVAAGRLDEGTGADSVGRLAFVCFCVLLSAMLRKIVRPTGVVIGNLLRSNPNALMYRLRWIWYPMAVGSPLCLAVLSLMGYQYTAEQLMMRLQLTLGLSIVLLITYTMLMQWMLAAKRSLAIKHARQRRIAALAAAQRESEDEGAASSPIPPVEAPQVNLSLLNQQMLRLVRGTACILFLTVSWAIWGQVLPALQVFSRIELWQIVVETTENIETESSGPITREITRVKPVTLGHLLLGIGVLTIAVLASRNVPGLLELAVLQRLPMDHGGRNAITTLCRYGFMLTGIIVASNTIGVSWGSVQWLVAALTVGLGFGLQEIFANFVSGLIILFERPVRIGDVVTIDGVSGAVSRIQIRATTITDWDRKEYIVPNKEFVTGKLLNWTLSDKTNRIVVNVGVAYGTDTERALALLQQIAEQHPLVLEDPPPVVGFEGFGDSTLNLVLRCYLPNLDHRLKVISQLHIAIDRLFKEEGIEIAFPQRDLRIRTMPSQIAVALNSQQMTEASNVPPEIGSENLPETDSGKWKRSA